MYTLALGYKTNVRPDNTIVKMVHISIIAPFQENKANQVYRDIELEGSKSAMRNSHKIFLTIAYFQPTARGADGAAPQRRGQGDRRGRGRGGGRCQQPVGGGPRPELRAVQGGAGAHHQQGRRLQVQGHRAVL